MTRAIFERIHKLASPIRRSYCTAAVLAAGLVLAACHGVPGIAPTTELAEALNEYRIVPSTRAYINTPSALLVMERDLGTTFEQRVTLPNNTALAGENLILLRAQTPRSASGTRLVLRDVLAQFGGTPTPFTNITESGLTARSDTYGDITYTVLRPGGDLTCVLAFRRSQIGARALPRGTSSLDIMMRNCVSGSVEDALAPIGPNAFGVGLPRAG